MNVCFQDIFYGKFGSICINWKPQVLNEIHKKQKTCLNAIMLYGMFKFFLKYSLFAHGDWVQKSMISNKSDLIMFTLFLNVFFAGAICSEVQSLM